MNHNLGRRLPIRFSMAMSPHPSVFAPLVFAGKLDEGIQKLSEAGFDGVEISLRHSSDLEVTDVEKRLNATGLEVSAIACGRLCLEESICLSNPKPEYRRQALEELTGLIKTAAHFHAPLIIGGVRGKLVGENGQRAEQRLVALDTLRKCARLAESLGTRLLIEPINRYETNFINSAEEGLAFLDEIACPAVKLLLDTFHMNIEESNPCASIRKAGARLGYVHFADSNRLAPGQGHVDFPAILQTLGEIGYAGFISAEILPIPDDGTALTQTGEFLHGLVGEEAVSKSIVKEN